MPYDLRRITIDCGLPQLGHAQKRALVPFIADGVDDHTIHTLVAALEKASAPPGAPPEAVRHRELYEKTTDELLGEHFVGSLPFGFPADVGVASTHGARAARLGTKISPLLLYAFVEHGGDAMIREGSA